MNESANSLIADLLLTPPQSKTELFTTFFKMGLQGFGPVLAAAESDLVQRKRWMTKAQFVEECAQAQLMLGPNLVNLCLMIGGRYFGIQGAAAALAGLLCIPLLLAGPTLLNGLSKLYSHPMVKEVRGVGLLAGVELLPKHGAECARLAEEEGLIVRAIGDTIAFCPPLIISEAEIQELLARFQKALNRL